MFDIIIVGAGPAGLTAAIYLARKRMKILVLTEEFGGQTAKAANVENYPGIDKIAGSDLIDQMHKQIEDLKVESRTYKVESIEKKDDIFQVKTSDENFEAKSVIMASGKTPRELGVPGEKEYLGKGVGYCVTCDGPLFKDKNVAIIGGGNSCLDSALEIEKYAAKIYLINVNEEFQGDMIRVEKVKKSSKIEIISEAKTTGFEGEQFLKKLLYEKDGEAKEILVDGVFVEIGWQPAAESVKDLVELNALKEIKIDALNQTKTPGLFAAGDVTETPHKQIIIAAGEGAKAALNAWKYIITQK